MAHIPLSSQEIAAKQLEAKNLIEISGLSQKKVSEMVGVSEKTIGQWIVKFKWKKSNEMLLKRSQAKSLVIEQGFQQREAANIVGVSKKTICLWAIKYKWRPSKEILIPTMEQVKFAVNNFLLYVDCTVPEISKKLRQTSIKFYEDESEMLSILSNNEVSKKLL